MAFTGSDYVRLKSDKNVGLAFALTGGATGVANVNVPLATELVYGGSRGFLNAAPAVSWQDTDISIQESETTSDPSLADDSTYEEFGQSQFGGSISMYYPAFYDDVASTLSNVYDVTEHEWTKMDVVQRIDGAKDNSAPIVDGDLVHVMRTITDGEDNSLAGSDALRRTVQFLSQGEMASYTVVGSHVMTAVPPAATPWAAGKSARLRITMQDRDVTNMDTISFRTSDPKVVEIGRGGFYKVTGSAAKTATITVLDIGSGKSLDVQVTVTA